MIDYSSVPGRLVHTWKIEHQNLLKVAMSIMYMYMYILDGQ